MTQQCEGPSDPHCSLKQYVPVPVKGDYLVRNGKFIQIHNLSTQVKGRGVETLGFDAIGWVWLEEWVKNDDV